MMSMGCHMVGADVEEDSFPVSSFCMALNIKDESTDRLVRRLAEVTGESITDAVAIAVRERLERLAVSRLGADLVADIAAIADRCRQLPELDTRTADEIIGYDERGVPA